MGAAIGAVLVDGGARVLTTLEGRSAETTLRAQAAGMIGAVDEQLLTADLVLSILPPDQAEPVARRLAQAMRRFEAFPTFVDCNAISPKTSARIGTIVAGGGGRYVDAGIIGLPPSAKGRQPTIYLSGDAADVARDFAACGLTTKVLTGGIGAASALKLSYAGLTKGQLALGVAMMAAADRAGIADALIEELAESQPGLLATLARGMADVRPKAKRWSAEMEEIALFLDADRTASTVYSAFRDLYRSIEDEQRSSTFPALETHHEASSAP